MSALVPEVTKAQNLGKDNAGQVDKRPLEDLFGATLGGALLQIQTDMVPKSEKGGLQGPLANATSQGQSLLPSDAAQRLQGALRPSVETAQAKTKQASMPLSLTASPAKDLVESGSGLKSLHSLTATAESLFTSPQESASKESASARNERFTFNGKPSQQQAPKPSPQLVREAPVNHFHFNTAATTDTVLIPQADVAPVTSTTTTAELPVMGPTLSQAPAMPPARSGRDGVVRVEIDSQLAVEVGQTEDGVEVLLEGAAKAVEQLRDVGTQLRNALEAGGFSLASFNTSERKETGTEHVSNAEKAEAKKVPARTKTFFGRGATLQIVA